MARYIIRSSQRVFLANAFPKYNGAYGKPAYLEFNISSPYPLGFDVGSYVTYRDGRVYRLYSVPEPKKQAGNGLAGDSFVYQNLQFHDQSKELENLIFTDLVYNSSEDAYFFSSRESTSTYEDLSGIIYRLETCLAQQSSETWVVDYADGVTSDTNLVAVISEPHEFPISGQSILEVCNQVADTWKGIGWLYDYDSQNDIHYIYFGAPNIRTASGTTGTFVYGKGNGLVSLKKYITNKDKLVTRLYAYGSERNMPLRHYNGQSICSADSVDIPNLMIPLANWGTATDPDTQTTLPDARLAYISNSATEETYGLIPRRVYFNNEQDGDIYPSIKGVTLQEVFDATDVPVYTDIQYYPPDDANYDLSERADEIKSAATAPDDGKINESTTTTNVVVTSTGYSAVSVSGSIYTYIDDIDDNVNLLAISDSSVGDVNWVGSYKIYARQDGAIASVFFSGVTSQSDFEADLVKMAYNLRFYSNADSSLIYTMPLDVVFSSVTSLGIRYNLVVPLGYSDSFSIDKDIDGSAGVSAYIEGVCAVQISQRPESLACTVTRISGISFRISETYGQKKTTTVTIKQIGFNLNDVIATNGALGTLNMLDGMCGGRAFTIKQCDYDSSNDEYSLLIERVQDDSTAMIYPNTTYPIAVGDKFVLTDIYMPDLYVAFGEQKLLAAAQSYYALNSVPRYLYTPEVDSAKIADGTYELPKPGMYMAIEDTELTGGTTEYVLIDSVTIAEGESSIPVVGVTLRERLNVPSSS